jgi:type IV fimbrial biogenesis protein FimT
MNQEGKSLIEMLMVLTIIGLASALAGPHFLTLASRVQVHSATEEIASELRLARQLALTKRDRVRLVFDLEQRTIVARFVNGGTTHHVYRYEDRGIVIEKPSAGLEILFHPSGRSATATTIQLRGREGQIQKLTVSLTGRVAVS